MLEVNVAVSNDMSNKMVTISLPCDDINEELEEKFGEGFDGDYTVEGIEIVNNPYDIVIKEQDIIHFNDLEEIYYFIDDLDAVDTNTIKAVMNTGGYSFFKAFEMVKDERVGIYKNIYSKEEFAQEWIDQVGSWAGVEIPRNSNITYYLDWEKIADELFNGDYGYCDETNIVIDFNW